jgi:hypothetical protein
MNGNRIFLAFASLAFIFSHTTIAQNKQASELTVNTAEKKDVSAAKNKKDTAAKPATPKAPRPFKLGSLVISGSVRARFEHWNWFDAPPANDNYSFGAVTLRVAIGQNQEKHEWLIEGAAPFLLNLPNDAIAPGAQGQLGHGASYFAPNGKRRWQCDS